VYPDDPRSLCDFSDLQFLTEQKNHFFERSF
jgi:hypothetical protein